MSIAHRNCAVSCILRMVSLYVLILSSSHAVAQKAIRFDREGAYLEVPNKASLQTPEMTIEFWLYSESTSSAPGGEQTLFDKRGDDKGFNIRLAGEQYPLPVFSFYLPSNEIHAFPGIGGKRWTHFAYVFTRDSSKIYQNGELIAATSSSDYNTQSTAPLRIGEFLGYPGATFRFIGTMDEIRIWSKEISAALIQSRMHEKLTGAEANLELYLDFEFSDSDWVFDRSHNKNNAARFGNASIVTSTAPIGYVPLIAPPGFRSYGLDEVIQLEWKPVSGAKSYSIYRSTSANFETGASNRIASLDSDQIAYVDAGIERDKLYYYLMVANDADGHAGSFSGLSVSRTIHRADYQTGVYYYPWYQPELSHHLWPGQYARYYMVPTQPPELGHYSSASKAVINQHFDWMEASGIDFIVSSWWGPNSREDVVLKQNILPEIRNRDLKFAVYYESAILGFDNGQIEFNTANIAYFKDHFNYLADTYFSESNYLKINGKYVVFLYLEHIYSGQYQQAIQEVRQMLSAKGVDLFLIGDMDLYNPVDKDHISVLDGASPYISLQSMPAGKYPNDIDFLNHFAGAEASRQQELKSKSKLFIPDVYPGFNNRRIDDGFILPRQLSSEDPLTSVYEYTIKVSRPFIDPANQLVMITSWNEWHEDTEIEPTILTQPTNTDSSPTSKQYTLGYTFKGYGQDFLNLTRDLLGNPLTSGRHPGLDQEHRLFNAYPNPVSHEIYLDFGHTMNTIVWVRLYALNGQMIRQMQQTEISAGTYMIPLNSLSPGLYFLTATTDQGTQTQKILVE
ncbi:MAG: T9SS type A sorting domain-containing protein [Lewinellaceae bacterium]|nr:T9SS type A sorting domain-containing protein [Lewinellaceae bacterium]